MKLAFLTDNYMNMVGRSVLDPFRRELLLSLAERCSEMLFVQANDYLHEFEDKGITAASESHVLSRVRAFRPDLVISLNRAGLNSSILSAIEAPVISWYIDNPNRFEGSRRRYKPGERIFCATRFMVDWVRQDLRGIQAQPEYLPFCTNGRIFNPDHRPKDQSEFCDVSFVGTLWEPSTVMNLTRREFADPSVKKRFQEGLLRYLADYNFDLYAEVAGALPEAFTPTFFKNRIDDFISTQRRLEILGRLADLDLEVYGTDPWIPYSLLISPRLYQACRTAQIQTPEQLASLYRRTRVGISIAHQQAQSGFPIRIFDILGAGLPLVTDRHQELTDLFEEGRMFLSYETPGEARECVLSLLRDRERAERMGSAAVDAIRENHNFSHRSASLIGGDRKAEISSIEIVSEYLDPRFLAESPATSGARIQLSPHFRRPSWQVVLDTPSMATQAALALRQAAKHSAVLTYRLLKFTLLLSVLGFSVLFSRRGWRKQRIYAASARDSIRDVGFGILLLLARANHELKKTIRKLHTSDS